ncbi:outer membrane beta-barrel protein [Chryseotalea sanaruensis]|uniref:outer membrane beta-barrel protein n=1 Tax=Chryseotalea sanaruensis TaxID=2482724 RepID=UPI000F8CEAB6|nr:outer membrane beta-barrel protein [Chryseotalea sanaruensis]
MKQTYALWLSPVIIGQFTINNKWKTAIRGEYYHDEIGIIIPINGFRTTGISLNFDYSPVQTIICRLEGRWLNGKGGIFETNIAPTSNNFIIGISIAVRFSEAL